MSFNTNNDNFGVLPESKFQNGMKEKNTLCEKCCFKWEQRKDHCFGYYFSLNVLYVKKLTYALPTFQNTT